MGDSAHPAQGSAIQIPGDEGLCRKPQRVYRVRMGERVFELSACSYEHAVVWLEVWCNEHGIERCGAAFEAVTS